MNKLLLAAAATAAIAAGAAAFVLTDSNSSEDNPATNTDSQSISGFQKPAQAATVGDQRLDFQLSTLDGQAVAASDFDGKVVVLNMWASWCPPCIKEMPMFVEMQDNLGSHGLQFVGLAIDQPGPALNISKKLKLNYPQLIDAKYGLELSEAYGNEFQSLPYTVIIGRDGQIRHLHMGEVPRATLMSMIEPLLDQNL